MYGFKMRWKQKPTEILRRTVSLLFFRKRLRNKCVLYRCRIQNDRLAALHLAALHLAALHLDALHLDALHLGVYEELEAAIRLLRITLPVVKI